MNENANQVLQNILSLYPITVQNVSLLSMKSGRTMWLVETDEGPKVLKNAEMKLERMLFIAGAHEHLQNNGLPIAPIIRTKNGALTVGAGESSFVLYDKIDGDEVIYYNENSLVETMQFMAQFHLASKGYENHSESKKRGRIGKWHKLFRWKLQELEGNKTIAEGLPDDPFSVLFLQHVDHMLERGRKALQELDELPYQNWTKAWIEEKGFCQQDFTMARFTHAEEGLMMKELHSITNDLPSRDIRILLNKVMKKMSIWDTDLAFTMLKAYDSVHPLTQEQYEVIWTELRFPHLFCSIIHKYYLGQKESWSDEKYIWALQNIISLENSKSEFLTKTDEMFARLKEGQ
ncbi:CotS family spore coat protein [Bacillus kexueae]|uniref:CotS family spore coat protein n=1 Tax=Aeribacillus kexueae TaxID=2078952 RepID=UPI001FAF5813|nr:CotS family spore coat protein [Bacillus kexueae]